MQIEIFKKCKGPESLPLSNENNPEGTFKLNPGEIIKSLNRKLKKLKSHQMEMRRNDCLKPNFSMKFYSLSKSG